MLSKVFMIIISISFVKLQLGGWEKQSICLAPNGAQSPYDLLHKVRKVLRKFLDCENASQLSVILIDKQVVAGQNYRAIWKISRADGDRYLGVKAYIDLKNVVLIKEFSYSANLALVFAGLGMPAESVKNLNCPVKACPLLVFPKLPDLSDLLGAY